MASFNFLEHAPPRQSVAVLGKLEHIDPRTVWAHEAHHFTPWLATQGDRLSEALGIDLELSGSEHPVGGFSLDLIGRDLTHDAPLIVENQLAESDHTHLGQLLTYAGGTNASTIVWIATRIREEHRQALTWLNEQTGDNVRFFGIELEVVRIGQSEPAALLNIVAQPNNWQKEAKAAASAAKAGGKAPLYQAFWAKFLERLHNEHPDWTRARIPPTSNWLGMHSPLKGTSLVSSFAGSGKLRSELYIDTGSALANDVLFDTLASQREKLETVYGRPLQWDRLDGRRACRVSDGADGDVTTMSNHDAYLDWFLDCGLRFRQALSATHVEEHGGADEGGEAGD